MLRKWLGAAVVAACFAGDGGAASAKSVDVRLLALNDFHGHVEMSPWLATEVKRRRTAATVVVSAGDLVGGSPLLSGLFHDEPTIESMNLLGLDLNAVGNHEFDEGATELLRLSHGGCHPDDGCRDGDGFEGARFGMLAANTVHAGTAETLLPPYAIRGWAACASRSSG